jgi:Arc/MetJ-type ribon-helix-helix transcriptional regulator
MTATKIAVSLPEHAIARARRAVRTGEAASISAFIARAIERTGNVDDLEKMLAEMLAETGGPPTLAERREFRREFGPPPKRGRSKKAGARPRR